MNTMTIYSLWLFKCTKSAQEQEGYNEKPRNYFMQMLQCKDDLEGRGFFSIEETDNFEIMMAIIP